MTLKQLLVLREIARHANNMSKAAFSLHMSQPAISRQVQLLEDELGVPIILRRRNRTFGLTAAGREMLASAERALQEVESIRRIAKDAQDEASGTLRLVTTHLHARHTLLDPMTAFIRSHPNVPIQLVAVSDPESIPAMLMRDEADLGVSTERVFEHPDVTMLKGAPLKRSLILPQGHPLATRRRIGAADIATYPLLGFGAASRSSQLLTETLQAELQERPLNFLARVTDTDVIKAYVARGLGIAVIPSIALEPARDSEIVARDVTSLFPESFVAVTYRKGIYLRQFVRAFIGEVMPGPRRTRQGSGLS